ncbi:MlaD family protein [Rhodoferax saidenbachensis]|uniref:MlaD family protein n=1 Tax=Rhodoferax saidenbachensis TaxID=1484693 RepID=UPI0004AC71B0|nr:MlaD family protein [Rhodoferax saidenbachensis]
MLIAILLWLASGGAWQKKYDTYLAVEDESVAGLNVDAPVKYNGVTVGKVQDIQLDTTNPQRVNLLFSIEHGTPVKQDTIVVLKTQGLTGIAYVELSGGSAASPMLVAQGDTPYPQIQTKPSLAARLENVLTSVLAKLDSTSNNINAILSPENQAAFRNALADIAVVTRTLAARKDSIDSGLADGATTLKNTAQASAKLSDLTDRVARAADSVNTMGTEVAKTSVSAGKTVDVIGSDVRHFSAETLPELERLLGELSTLSGSLRQLTDQTRRDPRGLIFGRTPVPVGPGETGEPR